MQPTLSMQDGPTIHTSTILTILSICANLKYKMKAFDIKGAYLNADLDTPINVKLSKKDSMLLNNIDNSFNISNDGSTIVTLNKALYGLKQSALQYHYQIRSKRYTVQ